MQVELRYRASGEESIAFRHAYLAKAFSALPPLWRIELGDVPQVRAGLQVECTLVVPIGPLKSARMHYVYRSESYLRDKGHFDDAIFFEIAPDEYEYKRFLYEILPMYIEIFLPYRGAVILDEDLALDDWDVVAEMRENLGKDIDGRDTVYRIGPVGYFDSELCRRSFGRSPEEIRDRLNGVVRSASIIENGVLLIYSDEILARQDIERVDDILRPLITNGNPPGSG